MKTGGLKSTTGNRRLKEAMARDLQRLDVATKHGQGISKEAVAKYTLPPLPSVEDLLAARNRRYTLENKYSWREMTIVALAVALFMFVMHIFTNAWYGF